MLFITVRDSREQASFYASTKRMDKNQINVWYLPEEQTLVFITNSRIPQTKKIPVFIFTENCLPFNLKKVNIGNKAGLNTEIWGFVDPKRPKLYKLSGIIWAPAFSLGPSIWSYVNENWPDVRIENKHLLKVPFSNLMDFIFKVYRGDRRCDKSQLPGKRQQMLGRGNKLWFFDLYVPRARIGSNQISKTAIYLKDRIRKQFRGYIPDYVHDIMIHISDNSSHSKAMYRYIEPFILDRKWIPALPES